MSAQAATPKYAPGDTLEYRDSWNRKTCGAVLYVEAIWVMGGRPLISYRLTHPTARNRQCTALESGVLGRAARATVTGAAA